MAAVNIEFPGNLSQVKTAADLRRIPTSLIPSGALYLVNELKGLFEYDSGSTVADDGAEVIRPVDKTPGQAGRWLKSAEGLAPGAPGATGPADNTHGVLASFKASSIANKTARLVGVVGIPSGTFNWETAGAPYTADDLNIIKADSTALSVGAWVRQASAGLTFAQPIAGAVLRSLQDKMRESISAADFGYGKPDNTPAQNSAAIKKAIDVQQTITGGALHIPYTTNSLVEPIVYDLTVGQPLIMYGDGQSSTVLRKAGNSAEPVMTLRSTGVLQAYHHISAMRFDNGFRARAGVGLKLVDIPRFVIDRCHFHGCATGLRAEGALIGGILACSALDNDIGYDITKSAAGIHANMIKIERGEVLGNRLGLRFDYGSNLNIDFVDFEGNGVTGDYNTGAIQFGNHLSSEAGYSQVRISGWFEQNYGTTIRGVNPNLTGAANISLEDCLLISNEAAQEVVLTLWNTIRLRSVTAPTGTWTTQATDIDGDITSLVAVLNDTSSHGPTNLRTGTRRYSHAMDFARIRAQQFAFGAQDLIMSSDDQILGGPTKDVGLAKQGDGELWMGTTTGKTVRMNQVGLGFFGDAPVTRPLNVPVTAAGVHAALVLLGLIKGV